MKRLKPGKALGCLLCILLTCALILAYPALSARLSAAAPSAPPGVNAAPRRLLTVWLAGDCLNAAPWVRAQAAAYAKTHKGVRVWIRTAAREDLQALCENMDGAPDLILFAPGLDIPADCLRALSADGLCAAYRAAGQAQGRQLAVPLCLDGYALVCPAREAAVTPSPTSLFGAAPTPDAHALPQATALPRESWPERLIADDAFGAVAMDRLGVSGSIAWLPAAQVPAALLSGQAEGALLTLTQARQCLTAGQGLQLLAAADITDRVVFGAIPQSAQPAAEGLLDFLLSASAQQALAARGLLPAREGITLYGADQPILLAAQQALREGKLLNAFTSSPALKDEQTIAQTLCDAR